MLNPSPRQRKPTAEPERKKTKATVLYLIQIEYLIVLIKKKKFLKKQGLNSVKN